MAHNSIRVKVEQGPKKGRKYKMKRDILVLGASEEADVVIPGPGVDPLHARLTFEGGQVKLEDLGSQEGTFRNDQRLLGPMQVFPGDRIGLGPEVTLILQGDGSQPETAEDEEELPGELGMASQRAE
jgi:pSer/pThr/pTyr-binding forkhead associated (FHA) protein